MSTSLPITPETRVAALLEAYPDLEEVLVGLAPPFAKLRNPVLRRTIARVTSLERAATVAGIPLRDMIATLRRAAGQPDHADPASLARPTASESPAAPPDWVVRDRVVFTLDADAMLDAGTHPVAEVQRRAADLSGDELGLVRASFRPAPLLDLLAERGFRTAVLTGNGGGFEVFIGRQQRP